ncbi:hypothetical protein CV093_11785 [Oceanobacillus sp. 143]|nr:hypothetical protein CV093_11785 [Oceanobacillus sp. 143]
MIQNLSTTADDSFSIRFYNDRYSILQGMNPAFATRNYPPGFKIDRKNYDSIKFNKNGSIINPRTIDIIVGEKKYLLVFPLGKGRFTSVKANGFTLFEVIIASAILFSVITTVVPIVSTLEKEQQILSDRRMMTHTLHDEMQPFIWGSPLRLPIEHIKEVNQKQAVFRFTTENEYIEGCVSWKNVRERRENICLFGIYKHERGLPLFQCY